MKWTAILFIGLVCLIGFTYGLGSFLHWVYYTAMILFSKITFAAMFLVFALVIVGLIALIINKNK